MTTAQLCKRRYAMLREQHRCVECAERLPEDRKHVRCVDCQGRQNTRLERSRQKADEMAPESKEPVPRCPRCSLALPHASCLSGSGMSGGAGRTYPDHRV